jgi:hypothetical protein
MALKRLTTAEMISLSTPWVDPEHEEHKALFDIEDTRPVLRRIGSAHAAILAAQPKEAGNKALAALQEEAARLDDEHDDLVRGTVFVLQGSALLQQDRAQRDALLRLKDSLFPTGPAATQRSFREEAGQAELLKGRLTSPMRSLLKSVPSPDGHLLTTIQRYQRAAHKLGALEDRRSAVRGATGPAASDMTTARNRWIRAVNVLIATLEQEDIQSPWAGTILERIRVAQIAADSRVEADGPRSEVADPIGEPAAKTPVPA